MKSSCPKKEKRFQKNISRDKSPVELNYYLENQEIGGKRKNKNGEIRRDGEYSYQELECLVVGRNYYGQCGFVDDTWQQVEVNNPNYEDRLKGVKPDLLIHASDYKKVLPKPRYPFKSPRKKRHPNILKIAAGSTHSLFIGIVKPKNQAEKPKRKIFVCGYNYNRQLGRHFTTNILLDINGNQIYEKDSRFRNTKNEKSQLNIIEEKCMEEPIISAIREFNYDKMIPSDYIPFKLSSGDDHTAIVFIDSQSNDTILLLMGSNHFGQLGKMPTDDADDSYYNLIGQFEYESDNWLPFDIWCGSNHTVIKSRRQNSSEIGYFTLGYDEEKIFGFNSSIRRLTFDFYERKDHVIGQKISLEDFTSPEFFDPPFKSVATRNNTNMRIDDNGDIWCWGCNQSGIMKFATNEAWISSPIKLFERETDSDWPIQIDLGTTSGIILYKSGKVKTFGKGILGYSFDDHQLSSPSPTEIDSTYFRNHKIIKVVAGDNCFGVISNTGEVYTWGDDGIKIGLGTKRSQPIPFRVPTITKCIDLAFGKDHLIIHTSRSLTNSNHSNYHD